MRLVLSGVVERWLLGLVCSVVSALGVVVLVVFGSKEEVGRCAGMLSRARRLRL